MKSTDAQINRGGYPHWHRNKDAFWRGLFAGFNGCEKDNKANPGTSEWTAYEDGFSEGVAAKKKLTAEVYERP